jgi:hypothetical protein
LNQANTSRSTRSEIGCFATGFTTWAPFQKSLGRSASSGGEVRAIWPSDTRRSFASSARPLTGRSGSPDCFEVRLAFMAVAHPGRDDPSNWRAGLGPVGVDHCQGNTLGDADRNDSAFTVVPARIDALEGRPVEDQGCELEVESSKVEILRALRGVPGEPHSVSIRVYIHSSQGEPRPDKALRPAAAGAIMSRRG